MNAFRNLSYCSMLVSAVIAGVQSVSGGHGVHDVSQGLAVALLRAEEGSQWDVTGGGHGLHHQQGPTYTFQIKVYALAANIANSQKRPRCPPEIFKNPPLIVLGGFGGVDEPFKSLVEFFRYIVPVVDPATGMVLQSLHCLLMAAHLSTPDTVDTRVQAKKLKSQMESPNLEAALLAPAYKGRPGHGGFQAFELETSPPATTSACLASSSRRFQPGRVRSACADMAMVMPETAAEGKALTDA
ncbi:hypothetical protein ABZP36_029717 [Zizania latifolia]